jgi:hypothetical protein
MSPTEVTIHVEGVELSQTHSMASELKQYLESEDTALSVQLRREDPTTQDLGAVLVLLAGTASAKAIAQGIRAWLAKRGGASVTVETPWGTVRVTNATSQDLAALMHSIAALVEIPE